jgi:hypothetical protein
LEVTDDLTAIVDPGGIGVRSPRDIDGGEAAARIDESMVIEISHDLAAVVDPLGDGGALARDAEDIDGCEAATCIYEATCPEKRGIRGEISHNLTPIVFHCHAWLRCMSMDPFYWFALKYR